jgi:hypothetical protein
LRPDENFPISGCRLGWRGRILEIPGKFFSLLMSAMAAEQRPREFPGIQNGKLCQFSDRAFAIRCKLIYQHDFGVRLSVRFIRRGQVIFSVAQELLAAPLESARPPVFPGCRSHPCRRWPGWRRIRVVPSNSGWHRVARELMPLSGSGA